MVLFPFGIERDIFAESHKLMQIHRLIFYCQLVKMFMLHFMRIESTVVGIDQIEICISDAAVVYFVHVVLWKKTIN